MDFSTLAFALAAGSVAALNPCGFAMLPAYLTLVVLGVDGESRGRTSAVARALAATSAMAVGFLAVFGTFGLIIAPIAASVQQYLPAITVVIGVGLIGLGGWLLTGREIKVLMPKPNVGAPGARVASMFGYGIAYAIASLSCTIGPFLAVTSATFRTGSIVSGVLGYLAYAAGMALVVGVAAVMVALAGSAATMRVRRFLPLVNRLSGALLVVVGLYVGYYGVYELRVYFADGDADDPVIATVGRLQQAVAGWVDHIGTLPLLGVLALLIIGAVTLARRRRSHVSEET